MPLLPRLSSLWRNLFRKDRAEQELREEVDAYLERLIEMKIEQGINPAEARRLALIEIGGVEQLKEQVREARMGRHVETLWRDLRYGVRMLLKNPGFTLTVVITLALGIGANTAIFTLINVVMLKTLPVSHPEELVELTLTNPAPQRGWLNITAARWEQIRDHQDVFSGVFAYGSTGADLSAGGEARRVSIGLVTGEFFSTLDVRPVIGRTLVGADDRLGCSPVAVITYAFWQSEYGGSADVVGKSVALNGQPFQIVGVADSAFFGVEFGYSVPIWLPQCAEGIMRGVGGSGTSGGGRVIGRLKPGVAREQSRARLAALAPALLEATIPPN